MLFRELGEHLNIFHSQKWEDKHSPRFLEKQKSHYKNAKYSNSQTSNFTPQFCKQDKPSRVQAPKNKKISMDKA